VNSIEVKGAEPVLTRIGRRWWIAILTTSLAVTLGGFLVVAVQRVRIAAQRATDL
jgi:hypothetical protein